MFASQSQRPAKRARFKSVSWAPEDRLWQVRLFSAEDAPSLAGSNQQQLQAKENPRRVLNVKLPPRKGARAKADPAAVASVKAQAPWREPEEFSMDADWMVVAGDASKEVAAESERQKRSFEAIYPRASAVPDNPAEPAEPQADHDDEATPAIPLIAIEEEEMLDFEGGPSQQPPAAPTIPPPDALFRPARTPPSAAAKEAEPRSHDIPADAVRASDGTPRSHGGGAAVQMEVDVPVAANGGGGGGPESEALPDIVTAAAVAAALSTLSDTDIDQALLLRVLSNPGMIASLLPPGGSHGPPPAPPPAAAALAARIAEGPAPLGTAVAQPQPLFQSAPPPPHHTSRETPGVPLRGERAPPGPDAQAPPPQHLGRDPAGPPPRHPIEQVGAHLHGRGQMPGSELTQAPHVPAESAVYAGHPLAVPNGHHPGPPLWPGREHERGFDGPGGDIRAARRNAYPELPPLPHPGGGGGGERHERPAQPPPLHAGRPQDAPMDVLRTQQAPPPPFRHPVKEEPPRAGFSGGNTLDGYDPPHYGAPRWEPQGPPRVRDGLPPTKMAPQFEHSDTNWLAPRNGEGPPRGGLPKNGRPCAFFNTPRGCRKGSHCPFEHERVPPERPRHQWSERQPWREGEVLR